ncbi:MAG: S-layer homology domain-containing protein [Syntrophomonadaceae bacterium]|nr:S-layer homology domain-containing protein [Syntrophomonadaceae bacterium]
MRNKLLVWLILICFIGGNVPQALARGAKDVPDGHWALGALESLNEHGIMQGYDGFFRPNELITRVEYFTLINLTFGFEKTVSVSPFADTGSDINSWKDAAVMKAAYQGYLKGADGYALPDRNITREEAMVILSHVLKQESSEGSTSFSDDAQISQWAKGSITAMWQEGYINGSGGKLNPKGNLTRAEAAQLIYSAMGELIDEGKTVDMGGREVKNVTILKPGVTLKNAVITGNLYITEGVGDGEVTLESVTVKGRTVISGGGLNSIVAIKSSLGTVYINVPDNTPVRLVSGNGTKIGTVKVNSSAQIQNESGDNIPVVEIAVGEGAEVTLLGDFTDVTLNSSNTKLTLDSGDVGTLTVAGGIVGTKIDLASDADIGIINFNSGAAVTGNGDIQHVNINASGVNIEQDPETFAVGFGLSATIGGERVTEDDNTGTMAGGSNGNSDSTPIYALNVTADPAAGGTVNGSGAYRSGYPVNVSYTENEGYYFSHWIVNGVDQNSDDVLTDRMPARDTTVVAKFVKATGDSWWNGTTSQPTQLFDGTYLIVQGSELAWVAEECSNGNNFKGKKFKQLVDINLNGDQGLLWTPIGYPLGTKGDNEGTEFMGEYNGNSKAIRNMTIDLDGRRTIYAGLFWKIGKDAKDPKKSGKVSGIKLDNADIAATAEHEVREGQDGFYYLYNGTEYVGGIAGANNGNISNCSMSGKISTTVGRIAEIDFYAGYGYAYWERWYSSSLGEWNEKTSERDYVRYVNTLGSRSYAGGIAASNSGTIEKCFNTAEISVEVNEAEWDYGSWSAGCGSPP